MKEISTKEQFELIENNEDYAIVKFYADWCPDCKRMDFFIGDILEKHSNKQWYKLNKDELPELAEKYDVMGIPSLLVFLNGEKVGHLHSANAKTPEQVEDFLDQYA